MKRFYLFLISFILLASSDVKSDDDWWKTAQIYQIYPRSFKDSNGDGIGDLNGITQQLGYLKEIGITATWLSPIFKSPMADFGYDISDFRSIQPEYGTMDDFDNLIKRAKELDIKILLDFVPNHSSDEHEWFKQSVKKDGKYANYYVWHDGYPDPNNSSNRLPPSNWLQSFRGSAWKWNDQRKQFYLHQFLVKQPDLNYRNPDVVEEMKNVLRFWLDRGVSGFRVDAVPCLFEVSTDAKGRYPNEPRSYATDDPENHSYLNHIYTTDQPETVDMVYQWREVMDDYKTRKGGDTRILLSEVYSPINVVMQYYGNATKNGSQIPFNFKLITETNKTSTAEDFVKVFDMWMNNLPKAKTPNWVIGNHDQTRVGTRYGKERIDTMNMMIMILPGVSVTYNGEEIGMLDLHISWNDTKDPAACNSNPNIYEQFSRDPERTPFQWNNTKNAGFSSANNTWLPVNPNYVEINVKSENTSLKSHLKIYKDLIALRQTDILKHGDLKYKAQNNTLFIERMLQGENFVLLANMGSNTEVVDLSSLLRIPLPNLKIEITNTLSKRVPQRYLATKELTLDPYEALILKGNAFGPV